MHRPALGFQYLAQSLQHYRFISCKLLISNLPDDLQTTDTFISTSEQPQIVASQQLPLTLMEPSDCEPAAWELNPALQPL